MTVLLVVIYVLLLADVAALGLAATARAHLNHQRRTNRGKLLGFHNGTTYIPFR